MGTQLRRQLPQSFSKGNLFVLCPSTARRVPSTVKDVVRVQFCRLLIAERPTWEAQTEQYSDTVLDLFTKISRSQDSDSESASSLLAVPGHQHSAILFCGCLSFLRRLQTVDLGNHRFRNTWKRGANSCKGKGAERLCPRTLPNRRNEMERHCLMSLGVGVPSA